MAEYMSAKRAGVCKVLLVGSKPVHRDDVREVLEGAGCKVVAPAQRRKPADKPSVIVFLLDKENPDPSVIDAYCGTEDYSPPVVVFGPPRGRRWRQEALRSGAFACLSGRAPREDQIGIVAAAHRYRALQLELEVIRREADIVIQGLLESFGSEAQRLKKVMGEAEQIRESLDEVQTRIIRSML